MELSSEDSLRLNVMIANAEAVRIDENALIVYGLNGEREMKVQLNPNSRSDKYLMAVREMLSAAVLDSPGGYPVFLRRWTRMGWIDETAKYDALLAGPSGAQGSGNGSVVEASPNVGAKPMPDGLVAKPAVGVESPAPSTRKKPAKP